LFTAYSDPAGQEWDVKIAVDSVSLTATIFGGVNFMTGNSIADLFGNTVMSYSTDCTQSYSSKRSKLNGPCSTPPLMATMDFNTTLFPDSTSTYENYIIDGYNISGELF
jgi:hypothetical protein